MLIKIYGLILIGFFSCSTLYAHNSSHTSSHMQHMNETRAFLKSKLKNEYDEKIPDASSKNLKKGSQIYMKYCVACHGTGGKGNGPAATGLPSKPADFTDAIHSKFYSDRGRIYIITNGVKGTPMVGWGSVLSQDEIRDVYLYIKSLRNKN